MNEPIWSGTGSYGPPNAELTPEQEQVNVALSELALAFQLSTAPLDALVAALNRTGDMLATYGVDDLEESKSEARNRRERRALKFGRTLPEPGDDPPVSPGRMAFRKR